MVSVSFVIPVHEEEEIVEAQLLHLFSFLEKNKIDSFEILPVENGSRDKTWKKVVNFSQKKRNVRPLRIHGASYGRAARHGMLSAVGKKIVLLDIDFIPENFVLRALRLLESNHIVIGSKNHPFSKDTRPFIDRLRTTVLHLILRVIFLYPGTDTHGIRAFRNGPYLQKTIASCFCKYELFDTELLLRLWKMGCSLQELPVSICEIRASRYRGPRRMFLVCIDVFRCIVRCFSGSNTSYLVRTADDYGMSLTISRAILDQYESGFIHIVSVLANLVQAEDGEMLRQRVSQKDTSLHLNFVREKPVLRPHQIPSLVNVNGSFFPLYKFIFRLFFQQIRMDDLRSEAEAQLQRLAELGIFPRYIDSEQHTHIFPFIENVVLEVAKKENLIIRSRESSFTYLQNRFPKGLFAQAIISLLRFRYNQQSASFSNNMTYSAHIVHPGSNYD